jgi:diamine N-acetyltransferase
MIQIKQVKSLEEIKQTAELAREIWQEHYIKIIGMEQVEYMLEKFQSQSALQKQIHQGYRYYIIELDNRPEGYIAIVPEDGGRGIKLSKIYIRKDNRKKGLGKKAIEFIESTAREAGAQYISLNVNKNNTASINWYNKMGFIKVGSTVSEIGKGFVMDDYIMEKRLS